MSGGKLACNCKSGAVEVWATSYPVTFYTNKIFESSKYVTDNISLGGQLCYFGASQKAWDALPGPEAWKPLAKARSSNAS